MNLTQRQLRMFVTTAALGNISRASEALHISQPALTRAIQELENQLGTRLFARSTRRLALTPEGERFLPVAQRLLQDLIRATEMIREESAGQIGPVSLAVGEAFACTVLPEVLREFARSYPRGYVRVVADNSEGITKRVVHGEVDFGIGSPIGKTEALLCVELLRAPLGLLANPGWHKLKTSVDTAQLEKLPLLRESSDTSIMHLLSAKGSDVVAWMGNGIEVSSLSLQMAMARAGTGIAVMSALGASHREAADMRFSRLIPVVWRQVFAMRRRDRPLPPSARALMDAIIRGLATASLHPSVRRSRGASKFLDPDE